MANLRDSGTLVDLRIINSEIRRTSEKMNNLLEDNMDLFTKDELMEKLEMLHENIDKLSSLSEKKDSPFTSDEELINEWEDLMELITTEYLALKSTILEKQVEKRNS